MVGNDSFGGVDDVRALVDKEISYLAGTGFDEGGFLGSVGAVAAVAEIDIALVGEQLAELPENGKTAYS